MKTRWVAWGLLIAGCRMILGLASGAATASTADNTRTNLVYILPVRDDIAPPMVYLLRRGVKEAMAAKADIIVLDMKTDGGRLDATEEIIKILGQFKGRTVTYVNDRAFSAGAFISAATQEIYMAPQSVIGAAAPIFMGPGGTGIQELPNTFEVKMNSAVRALVRTAAEKNGHNVQVMEAMIDKNKELVVDGKTLKEKGDILTLTNLEAERTYGDPPRPLLSLATVATLDELLDRLGYGTAVRLAIQPTGAEAVAFWINRLSFLLLIIGIVGIYIELKTPGFGIPGIVGVIAFGLYFLGNYVAGLSGLEWLALFVIGLILIALELFLFPGTLALGFTGVALMFIALIMAMVDLYPGMPTLPSYPQLRFPLTQFALALVGAFSIAFIVTRWLPKSPLYTILVSQSASGVTSVAAQQDTQRSRVGQIGIAVSTLRPGGKIQVGDDILDAVTQGEMLSKGTHVRIIAHSATEAVVEPVEGPA